MFSTLSTHLQPIAEGALKYFKEHYGRVGLKLEEPISPDIPWRPTFHLKSGQHHIIAVEIDTTLYPQVLRIARSDLIHHNVPITVYVAAPLQSYLLDSAQQTVRQLERDGLGLVVVDSGGAASKKVASIPLAQHIPPQLLKDSLAPLTLRVRLPFQNAYEVFRTNPGQGLQDAGQIVERLIVSFAEGLVRNTGVVVNTTGPASKIIDALYQNCPNQRAALGASRNFMKKYRNLASHPPRSSRKALEKLQLCRQGFLEAVDVCRQLREAASAEHIRLTVSGL